MYRHLPSRTTRLCARRAARSLGLGLVPLLAVSAGQPVGASSWDQVTLRPGESAYCDNGPCKVYLVMPPGSGSHVVSASDSGRLGVYPAGETVFLGSFWDGRHEFRVEGSDAPPAWVFVVSAW